MDMKSKYKNTNGTTATHPSLRYIHRFQTPMCQSLSEHNNAGNPDVCCLFFLFADHWPGSPYSMWRKLSILFVPGCLSQMLVSCQFLSKMFCQCSMVLMFFQYFYLFFIVSGNVHFKLQLVFVTRQFFRSEANICLFQMFKMIFLSLPADIRSFCLVLSN